MAHTRNMDMTTGTLGDKILAFVIPVAITNILQQLLNTTDASVVGQLVGDEAVAAVGGNASTISFIVSLSWGISLGANVVIASAIGARDAEEIHADVHTAVLVALLGGLACTALFELLVDAIITLLGVPATVRAMSAYYLRCYLLGLPVLFLYDFEAAILRAKGDTVAPLVSLVAAAVLNVALDLVAVGALGLGVGGAALATGLSMTAAVVYLTYTLMREQDATRLNLRELHIDRRALVHIIQIGLPAGVQGALFSASNIVIQAAINSLGETVMSGCSAAYYLEILAYYTVSSFGQATTTFVGQNRGARKPERCHRTLVLTFVQGAIATLAICGIILIFHEPLLHLFTHDPKVIHYGFVRLSIVFSAYGFSLINENMSGYLRGFGLSVGPAVIALICIVGARIAWITFFFPHHHTLLGLMLVYPATIGLNAVCIIAMFLLVRHQLGGSLSRAKAAPDAA